MKNLAFGVFTCLLSVLCVPVCVADQGAKEAESGKVLVFGGTGRLGSDISRALIEAGYQVAVFARPQSDRQRLQDLEIEYVMGDVLDPDQVAAGVIKAGPTVIVDALGRSGAPVKFYVDSARNIAQAGAAHGVAQIILHGSVGAGESSVVLRQPLSERTQRLYDAKSAGENALINSGVNFTIIRNWQLQRAGTAASGAARLVSSQRATGAVSRADLAELTVSCVAQSACFNQIYHAVQSSD